MGTAAQQEEDRIWHAQQERRRQTLSDAAPALLRLAKILLGQDDRFQVAIGGNPIAVARLLDDARAMIAQAEGAVLPSQKDPTHG